MSDSDVEFEKFLQESLSSSMASSILSDAISGKHLTDENEGGISTLGRSWLKSEGSTNRMDTGNYRRSLEVSLPTSGGDDTIEYGEIKKRRRSSNTSKHSYSEDPLNFSTGSGYSILSELEHQLGLRETKRPSSSHLPGEDTLVEEEDKKRFFEELENDTNKSLDYSELNRQLSSTTMSLRGMNDNATLGHTLRTIDEDDITPHVSSDNESDNDHTHLPVVTSNITIPTQATSSYSSLSSTSHHSVSLSPIYHQSPVRSSTHTLTPSHVTKSPKRSDRLSPISEKSGHPEQLTTSKNSSVLQQNDKNVTKNRVISKHSNNTVSTDVTKNRNTPKRDVSTDVTKNRTSFSPLHKGNVTSINTSSTVLVDSSDQGPIPKPDNLPEPDTISQGLVPKPGLILAGTPKPVSSPADERSLEELLRVFATEELASLTHEILNEDTHESKTSPPPLPLSSKPITSVISVSSSSDSEDDDKTSNYSNVLSNSTDKNRYGVMKDDVTISGHSVMKDDVTIGGHGVMKDDVIVQRQSELNDCLKVEIEQEKERVRELEERVKECVRGEEKVRLEYSQQVRELRTQLLETKAQLRKFEDKEQKIYTKDRDNELIEQEKLIQGYQKENEKLYNELTHVNKEYKTMKTHLLEENNKLRLELANMRVKNREQEESLSHYRINLSSHHDTTLSIQLDEYKDRCKQLEVQVNELSDNNQKLEAQLMRSRSPVTMETPTKNPQKELAKSPSQDLVSQQEVEEIKRRHAEEVSVLRNELESMYHNNQKLEMCVIKLNERQQDSLKGDLKSIPVEKQRRDKTYYNKTTTGPHLVKSRTAADTRKIKSLERQVQELQTVLKKRHPNSIPALIFASSEGRSGEGDDSDLVRHLESRVKALEKQLLDRENEGIRRIDDLKIQFHEMESLYEEQIASLSQQISQTKLKEKSNSVDKSDVKSTTQDEVEYYRNENIKLKDQVSKLSTEIFHQQLKLKGQIAEIENERRKTREYWESKIKQIESENVNKLDQLMTSLVKERSQSDLARLKSRLAAREAKIKNLEEELALHRTDSEILAVSRSREEELMKQVEILSEELLEAKKHHSPEMHHFSSLLVKISYLETRLADYQKKLEEAKSDHPTPEQFKDMEHRYKKQLTEKNSQIEHFREELDSMMDTLYTLQQGNRIIKR